MKVTIEKVPEGVRVTISPGSAKKPIVLTIQPAQLPLLEQTLRAAMASSTFRMELEM